MTCSILFLRFLCLFFYISPPRITVEAFVAWPQLGERKRRNISSSIQVGITNNKQREEGNEWRIMATMDLPDSTSSFSSIPSFPENNAGGASMFSWTSLVLPEYWTQNAKLLFELSRSIVLYKPPVGIAIAFVVARLLILRVGPYQMRRKDNVVQQAMNLARNAAIRTRLRRQGRSLDLDSIDRDYDKFGGVESIKTNLCRDHLMRVGGSSLPTTELRSARAVAIKALGSQCPPRGSRATFALSLINPLVQLESWRQPTQENIHSKRGSDSKAVATSTHTEVYNVNRHLEIATRLLEIRFLDAVLRILRDGQVLSGSRMRSFARRLERNVNFYDQSLSFNRLLYRWYSHIIRRSSLERDRERLGSTEAMYQLELNQLGRIENLLLSRPNGMTDKKLGPDSDGDINPWEDIDDWNQLSESWCLEARTLIRDIITETMSGIDPTYKIAGKSVPSVAQDLYLLSQWAKGEPFLSSEYDDGTNAWRTALTLTDELSAAKRLENRRIIPFLSDAFRRLDFYGVPSSIFTVALAFIIHQTVKPHWKNIINVIQSAYLVLKGIWLKRFYGPISDIVLDLLNRKPRLLDPFLLSNEEMGLDNMLRDLGVGNGTPETRNAALASALRMYEAELQAGALRNVFRGKMVRLLLIQVQQLKVDLLTAFGSIDDLVDSNRLNVELLAAIPAILLAMLGTRFILGGIVRFRSKDFRPARALYAKMTDYLDGIERCLLLSGREKDKFLAHSSEIKKGRESIVRSPSTTPPTETMLGPSELGEFLVLTHSYTVLLDFTSPPFPMKSCDAIHRGLQDLLMEGQLSTSRQISLLGLIKARHAELEKSL